MMLLTNGFINKTDKELISLSVNEQARSVRITEEIEKIVGDSFEKQSFVEGSDMVIYEILLDKHLPNVLNKLRKIRDENIEKVLSVRGETERRRVYELIKDMILLSDLIEDYFQLKMQNDSCVLLKF